MTQTKQNYWHFSRRAPHLAIKSPTLMESTSYTVMRKLPGRELYDIISEVRRGQLSIQNRIDLSKALLQALKKQVTDKGLVHKDIKVENILVNLGPPMHVNIIDYAFAIERGTSDGKACGTRSYIAPEIVQHPNMISSPKSDVYSLGRVIALLWNVDLTTYNLEYYNPYVLFSNQLKALFSKITGLEDIEKLTIRNTLTGMLSNNPVTRSSLDDAIKGFEWLGTHIDFYSQLHDWVRQLKTANPNNEALKSQLIIIDQALNATIPNQPFLEIKKALQQINDIDVIYPEGIVSANLILYRLNKPGYDRSECFESLKKNARLLQLTEVYLSHLKQELLSCRTFYTQGNEDMFLNLAPETFDRNHVLKLTLQKYQVIAQLLGDLKKEGDPTDKLTAFKERLQANKILLATRRDGPTKTFLKGVLTIITIGIAAVVFGIWRTTGQYFNNAVDNISPASNRSMST